MLDVLNTTIGLLGLILSLVAFYFTYISFVNPILRFKKLLKNSTDWELFHGVLQNIYTYRHRNHPQFQIVIDYDKEVNSGFRETWVNYPLMSLNNSDSMYNVSLEVNGMLLKKELFVSLDGHRYFVPLPKFQPGLAGEKVFYYDKLQIQLSKIIGKFHSYRDIYEFAKAQNNLFINETISD